MKLRGPVDLFGLGHLLAVAEICGKSFSIEVRHATARGAASAGSDSPCRRPAGHG